MYEEITQYISPELLILIPVLYLIGVGLCKSKLISNNLIPLLLGCFGICLAWMYEVITCGFVMNSFFAGFIQGVLCAGAAVYANQIYKQTQRRA